MTVKELIEYLKECNPDLPVAVCTDDFYGYYSEVEIEDINADTVEKKPYPFRWENPPRPREKFDALVIRIY